MNHYHPHTRYGTIRPSHSGFLAILLALTLTLPWTGRGYEVTLMSPKAAKESKYFANLEDLIVEDFEDRELIDGLETNVSGGASADGDDTGRERNPSAWDGLRASSAGPELTRFNISIPDVETFAIGVGDNDGDSEVLSINQGPGIPLGYLPNYASNGFGVAYFLVIEADEDDAPITDVQLADGMTLEFDHLVLERAAGAPSWTPGAANGGVSLMSAGGERFVGRQFDGYHVDRIQSVPELEASQPSWIYLYHTERRSFVLQGEVKLGGMYQDMLHPEDFPDGFSLFIREWDGLRRYQLDSRKVLVKRRLLDGEPELFMNTISEWPAPELGVWIPFRVRVAQETIEYRFGDYECVIEGPLDIDGANKIASVPGTRLRNLKLKLLDSPRESADSSVVELDPIERSNDELFVGEAPGGAENLVHNGDFESFAIRDETGVFGEPMWSPTATGLTHWEISNGMVGLQQSENPTPNYALELGPRNEPGSVAQVLRTRPGVRYEVRFRACSGRSFQANNEGRIRVGSVDETFDCSIGDVFELKKFQFEADSSQTRLELSAIGNLGFGPLIDDVTVVEMTDDRE